MCSGENEPILVDPALLGARGCLREARDPHLGLPDLCFLPPNAGADAAKVDAVVRGLGSLLTSHGEAAMLEGILEYLGGIPADAEAARKVSVPPAASTSPPLPRSSPASTPLLRRAVVAAARERELAPTASSRLFSHPRAPGCGKRGVAPARARVRLFVCHVTGKAVPPHVSFMRHRSAGAPRPAGAFGRSAR